MSQDTQDRQEDSREVRKEVRKKTEEGKEWGAFGEQMAMEYLVKKGYSICERNWHSNHHELDIIAQTGETIVFVEVKSRNGRHGDPLESIDSKKVKNIIKAANAYLNTLDHEFDARFDIITLVGNKQDYDLEHIEDAFFPPLQTRF